MDELEKKNEPVSEDKLKPVGDAIGFILIGVIGPLVGVLIISLLLAAIFPIDKIQNPWGISDELFIAQIIVSIVLLIVKFIIVFWIYKASMEHGMPSPPAWSLMALFFPIITLLLYYYNKPEGELVECQICGRLKLDILYECPHCRVRKENLPKSKNRKTNPNKVAIKDMGRITPTTLVVKKKKS